MQEDEEISAADLLPVEELDKLYNNLRAYTIHEDNLIGQRLTWLLAIQGFLFATYAIVIQQISQSGVKATELDADTAKILLPYLYILLFFGLIIIVSSLAFIYQVGRSISAASRALTGLRAVWTVQHKAYQIAGHPKYLKPTSSVQLQDRFFSPIYGQFPYLHGGGHRIPSKDEANRHLSQRPVVKSLLTKGPFSRRITLNVLRRRFIRKVLTRKPISVQQVDATYLGFAAADTIPKLFQAAWLVILIMHALIIAGVLTSDLPLQAAHPAIRGAQPAK